MSRKFFVDLHQRHMSRQDTKECILFLGWVLFLHLSLKFNWWMKEEFFVCVSSKNRQAHTKKSFKNGNSNANIQKDDIIMCFVYVIHLLARSWNDDKKNIFLPILHEEPNEIKLNFFLMTTSMYEITVNCFFFFVCNTL